MASEDFDRRLASFVEQHPTLYDRSDLGFGIREQADKAWSEIADSMEAHEYVVRTRWKDLRRSFTKAYREIAKSAPACKRSCIAFPFFESMLWLAPYIRKKRLCSASLKIMKCPVHGDKFSRGYRKTNEPLKTTRKESVCSETSAQTSSSFFTESSYDNGDCVQNRKTNENNNACEKSKPRDIQEIPTLESIKAKYNEENQEKKGNNTNKIRNRHDLNTKKENGRDESQYHNVESSKSSDKQNNLTLSRTKKSEFTQTDPLFKEREMEGDNNNFITTKALCQGFVNADINFMISVLSDMQLIPNKRRIIFKREVMELIEKYVFSDV